jgi:hypothetical protein
VSRLTDLGNPNTTYECREGQHTPVCRGDAWSMSADAPTGCRCWCHDEPPACLDDSAIALTPEAELLGDAIRHERNDW